LKKTISLLSVLLFCTVFAGEVNAQTTLTGGTINQYTKVVSIDAGDKITVSGTAGFFVGDTVLIIQMKGTEALIPNTSSFGILQNVYSAGKYEFIIITGISGNQITFITNLSNIYDPGGSVQLVKVPGYNNVIIAGDLTCQPWDSVTGTGGVLTMIVGGSLSMNADIDVSGKGFKGGDPVAGNGDCGSTDVSYKLYYFSASADSAGFKGEGSVSYGPGKVPVGSAYFKGRAAFFNGGGGGNANMAGGGGGSNMGSGGLGGTESKSCASQEPDVGGNGGMDIPSSINWADSNLIFIGAGGGSGTQFGGTIATVGGNGGGIVIIMADTLEGNNHIIRANGQDITTNATGGAGGGGGGGSVLLSINVYSSPLNAEAKGGQGGSTNGINCTGAGGGGGGGLVWYAISTSSGMLNSSVVKGNGGLALSGSCVFEHGSDGADGILQNSLKLPLTGFLFNTIFSANTSLQTDTICEGDIAPKLLGTNPEGGIPPYTFMWESSTDLSNWNIEALGTGFKDFIPVAPLVDTTYYRRTVSDAPSPDQIIDISKEVTIIVQPRIIHDTIIYNDSTCSGMNPDTIFSTPELPSGGNGPGSYSYLWQEKSAATGNIWVDAQSINNLYYYLPPVKTVGVITEVQFRRIISSGIGCPDTITLGILNYLPALVNVIASDQEICDGDTPQILNTDGANPVAGGSGSYMYKWFESIDNVVYNQVIANNESFQPPALSNGTTFTKYWYYKRKITSSACKDTSAPVTITVYPVIDGNSIGRDTAICKGTAPNPLTGTTYSGGAGAGTYSFQWLISSDDVTYSNITGAAAESYNPGNLISPTYYKRVVISDFTPNSCVDTATTPVFVNIHPVFNTSISDLGTGQDTVCNGLPGKVTISMSANAPWNIRVSNDQGWDTLYAGVNTTPVDIDVDANYAFAGNTALATIQYQIDSVKDIFGCNAEVISGTGKVVAVRAPVADAGLDIDFCGLTTSLNATLNYGTGTWSGPIGVNFADPADPKTGVSSLQGTYLLTWTTSGAIMGVCPDDTDQNSLTLWEPPSPAVIIPVTDTTLAAFANEIQLSAGFPAPRVGDILWEMIQGQGTFDNDTARMVFLGNLDWGDNVIRLTISNGSCPDKTNTRTVTVLENPDIPSGISPRVTPNQNDFFRVENIGNVTNELTVFSRLGNIVFRTENFMTADNFPDGWDGTDMHGNPLPDDTYYYILKVEGTHPKTFTGFIIIKGSN